MAIICVCMLIGTSIMFRNRLTQGSFYNTAVITKIAVSTATITATLTYLDEITPVQTPDEYFSSGAYVQIYGTGGIGLSIRAAPGIDNQARFVAMENEVFTIMDGPELKDGFFWWKVVSSYDENRQGWAAGQYLQIIQSP
ncbi:MAG: SH3 domain-containing protein [Anaerolineaceae bacterium]|nr:SH3 domain-containing protein [Anaerolineaceae bacterium]